MYEHFDKHRVHNGLRAEREYHVGVSFALIASHPNLWVASQHQEYMLDRLPMVGWKIALTQPIAWIFFI